MTSREKNGYLTHIDMSHFGRIFEDYKQQTLLFFPWVTELRLCPFYYAILGNDNELIRCPINIFVHYLHQWD